MRTAQPQPEASYVCLLGVILPSCSGVNLPVMRAQAVEMGELMEAVGRTRFGVNGGGGSVLGQGLQRRLWDWVVENLSSSRTVRSLPVSGS